MPETRRIIVVTPDVYVLMKQCKDIVMETDIGNDLRIKGVIENLDGAAVVKVPARRLPKGFGFMIAHPCATVAPTKLENKAKAIYYQAQQAEQETPEQETT